MPKAMVIVESPAKARTIEKYLGKDYRVRACAGHIKDLPRNTLGVDIKHDFSPSYEIITGKEKIVRDLKKESKKLTDIYLAADPDREGEAICQHLVEELSSNKNRRIHRVLFNEITKTAILEAFKNPSEINQSKVEAQQARRILDRLVGYKVSPLLWKKVRKGLSAGRVQTIALRMIVEREREVKAFKPVEYWNFTAHLGAQNPPPFKAKAFKHKGKKFKISNQQDADRLSEVLKFGDFLVSRVKQKETKRNPVPPFITSKLQQEASRKLRFAAKKTMMVAQRLYEGIDMGEEGSTGLITYMRTDSTRVSGTALTGVREYIEETYGTNYLPSKAVVYRAKKGAQDAHEAIRPTSVLLTPDKVKNYLGRDEFRLYDLIWKRFVASQMTSALFDQTEIVIKAGSTDFKAIGTIMKFDGFLKIYQEGKDDSNKAEDGQDVLPRVVDGEKLLVEKIVPEQKFTQPPPRYTEATLVKALEEKGIGRPSTYAQICAVNVDREYVEKNQGRFVPSETGEVVIELLIEHFGEIFDYDYTAKLEQDLDEIESGREHWLHALQEFYAGFSKELKQAEKDMKNLKKEEVPAGIDCDKCGSEMVIRWGRFGRFMACSGYPECKNTRELEKDASEKDQDSESQEKVVCEKCGQPMVRKKGRYGEFMACSGYPECKNTREITAAGETGKAEEPIDEECPQCGFKLIQKRGRYGSFIACSNYPECKYIKQETSGVSCPQCQKGELIRRKSRRGSFYGCNSYPECKFIVWQKPLDTECPSCGSPYLLEKNTKKEGLVHSCPNSECDYSQVVELSVDSQQNSEGSKSVEETSASVPGTD